MFWKFCRVVLLLGTCQVLVIKLVMLHQNKPCVNLFLTVRPHDVQGQEELAKQVESIADEWNLDLSDPLNTFPGPSNPFFSACEKGNLPIIKVSFLFRSKVFIPIV